MYCKTFLIFALALLGMQVQPRADDSSRSVEDQIIAFYKDYEKSLNDNNMDEALRLINLHVAEDFGHYDDGKLAYDKAEFLGILEKGKADPSKQDVKIEILDIYEAKDVPNEVRLNFKIYQNKELGGVESKALLQCHDSLRVLPETESVFQLYRCDCKTLL